MDAAGNTATDTLIIHHVSSDIESVLDEETIRLATSEVVGLAESIDCILRRMSLKDASETILNVHSYAIVGGSTRLALETALTKTVLTRIQAVTN